MESKQRNQEDIKPPAPLNISKENLGVWIGWTFKGDREVSREAAAKGHIDLALEFLLLRKNTSADDVRTFVRNEISVWVDELLDRKQIFRVSHILNNIGVDPILELEKVFCKTQKHDLRQYIGNHLQKVGKLSEKYQELWTFLDFIIQNKALIYRTRLKEECIECLDQQSETWKYETAAKIFLNTFDNRLIPFIKPEVLWLHLLVNNEVYLLKTWIHISYSDKTEKHFNVHENLLMIFKSFEITTNMVNDISNSSGSPDTRENILNELGKFGIFSDTDRNNIVDVLARVHKADNIINIYKLLGQKFSNLPIDKFMNMLVDYCLENNLLTMLNACTRNYEISTIASQKNSPHLDLMLDFRTLIPQFSETQLRDNIFKVSKYLSDGNLEKYFCDNPLIFLSLLICTKDISIETALENKALMLCNEELFPVLSKVMENFHYLSNVYHRKVHGVKCSLTYFDLLEKHAKINVKMAFSFHFEERLPPNFNSLELREGFAYSKKVNYTFYLRQCRPSIASKNFFIDLLKSGKNISEDEKKFTLKKVFKIAIANFQNTALSASCICFLEMIGLNSELLRVSIKSTHIFSHSGMDEESIKSLFLSLHSDPCVVQSLLDETIVRLIDFTNIMSSGAEFIKAVKLYDIVVKFSVLHNLPLPELFLKHLTQHNYWFPFLLYAQIKNYPQEQIKAACTNFKNPNLLEHIVHSVINDIQLDETNVLMGERDSRKYFLSRIGVRRSIENVPLATSSTVSRSTVSVGSNQSSSGSEVLEIDISNTKVTLLQILIRCHNSTDPPKALLQACQLYRNPLLAILATSYEPDSVIINWITWLSVSTELYQVFTNFESLTTCGQSVADLLNKCMINRFPKTLIQSFQIFIPDNPLASFIDFLNTVIQKEYDVNYLKSKLDKFKTKKSGRRASVLTQTDYEMTYLKNNVWIESTALQLLSSAVTCNTDSYYEQLEFVEVLCKINIAQYFTSTVPNFDVLRQILAVVFECSVKLKVADFLDGNKEKDSIQNCINELVNHGLFEEALLVAKCSAFDTNYIVLKKWQTKYEQREIGIQDFLIDCDNDFALENVCPESAISFFKERVGVNDIEKYYLLKFSHKWAASHNLNIKYILERKKILAFVNINHQILRVNELIVVDSSDKNITFKEMRDILKPIEPPKEYLTKNMYEKLEKLLSEALNEGSFWFALKLEKMFNCATNDLELLKLCHNLAEGVLMPYQLNDEQRLLVCKAKEFHRFSYRKGFNSRNVTGTSLDESEEYSVQDCLAMIHSLIEKLNYGLDIAYSIFMMYRISVNIEVPYPIVVSCNDHIKMLKDALDDNCMNKLEVVHDFLSVFQWNKEQVSDFFCEQIVNATSTYSKSKTEMFTMWEIKMESEFHLVLKLLKDDCSTLGYKLYNYASAVHKVQISSELDFKISELVLVVELLIAAHNCFTTDCNMKGIFTILKKSQVVISHLLTLRSWKLIVRLLTGVGRYTEMNYVFQILKENDQFEFLLRKGSRRDERLKIACLEYLKKYCPENRQLYKLVALHFALYSEVAMLWEREAQGLITNLIAIAKLEMENNKLNPETEPYVLLSKSDGTTISLNKAMENYIHATEFLMQGDKLTKAMNAAKQAELIALQKSLLKTSNETAVCLLNLSTVQINSLISKDLNFHQSYILAQAYNHQPEWASVLFDQCILKNNMPYFDLYLETLGLNETLLHDISRKFLIHNINTEHGIKNMKHILSKLGSVHAKYRFASELGFTDLVADLLDNAQIAYLRDTVWKKGYKSSS